MTGEVVADIFASTTGTDNDMVVKLIDQYPDDDPDPKMRGYQLMTNAEIFRGRYLDELRQARRRSRAGSVHEYKYSLHDVDHVFKAGHTVMVEIQSTWFPLYDRNPQTFVPNIMTAKPGGLQAGDDHDLLRPGARIATADAADERLRPHRVLLRPVEHGIAVGAKFQVQRCSEYEHGNDRQSEHCGFALE